MSRRGLLLGLALALVLLPSNLVPGVLPLLGLEWGANATTLGWVVSSYQLGYALAVIVVLPLTDRFSPARVIVGGAIVTTIANALLPVLAHDPLIAIVLRTLAGFGLAGVYMPGVRLVAAAATREQRGLAVGAYVASFYLGSSISFLATGMLLGPIGWRGAAVALAVAGTLALPFAALGARGLAAPPGGRAHLDLTVLRDGGLRRTILAYSGHSLELFVVRAWLASFLAASLVATGAGTTDASATASRWAAILLAFGVPMVAGGGALSDRIGRGPAAVAIATASGALSLGFGLLAGAPFALLLVVGAIYGALLAADSAVYSVGVTEAVTPDRLGSAQAIQAFSGFGFGALGPALAGLALDTGLGYVGVFGVAGVVGLITVAPLAVRGVRGGGRAPATPAR